MGVIGWCWLYCVFVVELGDFMNCFVLLIFVVVFVISVVFVGDNDWWLCIKKEVDGWMVSFNGLMDYGSGKYCVCGLGVRVEK